MNKHIKFETNCVWIEGLKAWIVSIVIDGQVFTGYNDKLKGNQEVEALDWVLEFRKSCKIVESPVEFETKPDSNAKRSPLPKELGES